MSELTTLPKQSQEWITEAHLNTLITQPLRAVGTQPRRHSLITTGGAGEALLYHAIGPPITTATLRFTHEHVVEDALLREPLLADRTVDEWVH